MKRIFLKILLFCFTFVLLTPTIQTHAKDFNWYVKRNAEHKQPLCDAELSFIEQNGGIYVDENHGDDVNEKVIYLTFDVGYENGNVAKIMDVLKNEGVKGSFFVLGNVISREPELIKRMVDEGHSVCNHTLTHKKLTGASFEEFSKELKALEDGYRELTGKELSKFFRPPEGTFNGEMLKMAQSLGYKTVFWSFAYADWDNGAQMSESAALKKILDNIHNGEIMLLHPTSATNASIMERLIRELKSLGYRFATLDEM
jgi:peptidoglycan-N-acetylmuramic acid deacetylase